MRFLLATHNKGKVREIRLALSKFNIEFDSLAGQGHLSQALEVGSTFAENARLKAEHYYQLSGSPTLAEDSGILVEALDGKPGVHSARFAPTDKERVEKLLRMLDSFSSPFSRGARFVSAICLFLPDHLIEVTGEVQGELTREPRGTHGFGYDPIFYYPPLEKTFAQLTTEEKNKVSHRARALEKLSLELAGRATQSGRIIAPMK
ncbi:MAG: RdgB/HAM1 family non-canonical purine NTP pyrophosphatase [Acidobacteria bacterium]|nr:RdgB/HAM1 family non-canonical purine NTP pyrophosphatase [Acidobacteriota bacterium]MCZ6768230.1 RdgB/HAM1 family non-canonical purine NTP pyrophosphatase [Acidobacteriota bacterium]MCZ6877305.1 RdgB/HAM1 family non-canonical purine NTP pyrophosphatase [Acidobacteriota bacterium]